ncbi:MAG TPA: hypothetical protein VHA77_02460 [Xanthobacteraceae bacterium]|nr:hypothetical protein [Xanthobacteraceae bacterium]
MSDPRTPYNEPRTNRAVDRTNANTWAWIAGIVALVLIAWFIFGYGNWGANNSTAPTASNQGTTQQAPTRPANPPSTTGQGGR